MIDIVENIREQSYFEEHEKVVIALSGGVDSMVLLDVLKRLGLSIIIAHVNHNVRSESADELEFLRLLAEKEGYTFESHVIKENIPSNFQATARRIRYNFFHRIALKNRVRTIVLAHHLDDQVENYFMRLINNHDTLTLKGMQSVEIRDSHRIVRPFLNLRKEAIRQYATENDIRYFEDRSNLDKSYTRNRFRHDILPMLTKENPRLHDAIKNHMDAIADFEALVGHEINRLDNKWGSVVPVPEFLTLSDTIKKHYLLNKLKMIDGEAHLSENELETIIDQIGGLSNFKYDINESVILHKEYDVFFLTEKGDRKDVYISINGPGEYHIQKDCLFIVSHDKISHKTSKCLELWYNDSVFPLYLRNRSSGDYMTFSYGRKKVKNLLIDMKISPYERDRLILLAKGKEVLWIPELDIRSKQESGTKKIHIAMLCDNNNDM